MAIYIECTTETERQRGITAAKSAIRRGECIVIPTDTVYGIAVDPFMPDGVNKLLSAKGRGRDMPVPVLVPTFAAAIALAKKLSPAAKDLMDAFWPGPLTIVVAQQPTLSWDLGDTDGTVALRMPLQRTALELLAETGPLAVSSANISGQPPATSAKMALEQLGESVSIYLEMGETTSDIPSTIVDATSDKLQIIRLGALSKADLVEIVGEIAFKSSDE